MFILKRMTFGLEILTLTSLLLLLNVFGVGSAERVSALVINIQSLSQTQNTDN